MFFSEIHRIVNAIYQFFHESKEQLFGSFELQIHYIDVYLFKVVFACRSRSSGNGSTRSVPAFKLRFLIFTLFALF